MQRCLFKYLIKITFDITESNSTVTAAADTTIWLVIVILECFVTCTVSNS